MFLEREKKKEKKTHQQQSGSPSMTCTALSGRYTVVLPLKQ